MKEKLDLFTQKLLEWNQVHNLTGAKTKEEVAKNIEDSLRGLEYLQGEFQKAIDIGTGAGFPGLVLAIAMPKTQWLLVEPRKKRASFLNYTKTLLDLQNVEVAMKRIEEVEPSKVDLITSRAVMKTKDLLKLLKPFTTPTTTLLLYKGENVEDELQEIKRFKLYPRYKGYYLVLKGEDVT